MRQYTPFTLEFGQVRLANFPSNQHVGSNNGSKLRNAKEKGNFLIDLSPPSLNVELLNESHKSFILLDFQFLFHNMTKIGGMEKERGFSRTQRRGWGRGVSKCVQNSSIKLSKPQFTRL